LVLIAKKQIQELNEFQQKKLTWVLSDTWLIITKIWFEEVFGKSPVWLETEIKKTKIDLFLVCDTDLPWEPDFVRENGGEKRIYLQQRYIENIINYGFNYKIVSGKNEIRLQNALHYLKPLE
jgi:nicotinamide riboside kinase